MLHIFITVSNACFNKTFHIVDKRKQTGHKPSITPEIKDANQAKKCPSKKIS